MKFTVALFGILAVLIVNSIESYVIGGWKDVDLADVPNEVTEFGLRTARAGVGGRKHAVRLIGVKSAKTETAAGKGYRLEIKTETTNCTAATSPAEIKDSETCPTIYSSACTVQVFKSLNSTVALAINAASCSSVL